MQTKEGPLTYSETGRSRVLEPVKGYDNDYNRVYLGRGEAVFEAACQGIRKWEMFPGGWARIAPGNVPIETGQVVAMVVRVMGFHWVNNCRIVYVLDEMEPVRRYGFAYGTMSAHIEKGEELFSIEWLEDDTVWYVIRAFSRPSFWLVRLAYPVARYYQRRFVRGSFRAMQRAVQAQFR